MKDLIDGVVARLSKCMGWNLQWKREGEQLKMWDDVDPFKSGMVISCATGYLREVSGRPLLYMAHEDYDVVEKFLKAPVRKILTIVRR